MIHFLATNSLAVTLERAILLALFGWVTKLLRTHVHLQRKIADRLDTSTPGGLSDVVTAVEKKPAAKARKRADGSSG